MVRPKSFLEREDTGVAQAIEVAVGLVILLLLAWIGFNQPDQGVKNAVFSLSILGLLASVVWSVDLVSPKNRYTESIGFGRFKDFKVAAVAGIIFGFVFFVYAQGSPNALVVPFSVSFAGLAVLAAFVEELSFRSVIIPSLARLSMNFKQIRAYGDYIGIVLGSVLFGVFHYLAYGASTQLMIIAFVFSIVMVAGNTVFKSTAFGYAAHPLYNALVLGVIVFG